MTRIDVMRVSGLRELLRAWVAALSLELGTPALDSVPFGAVRPEDDAIVNLDEDVPASVAADHDRAAGSMPVVVGQRKCESRGYQGLLRPLAFASVVPSSRGLCGRGARERTDIDDGVRSPR